MSRHSEAVATHTEPVSRAEAVVGMPTIINDDAKRVVRDAKTCTFWEDFRKKYPSIGSSACAQAKLAKRNPRMHVVDLHHHIGKVLHST